MPQTDIIARIREGDRETFNAFCRERYASLIAFARLFLSRINGTWADDVVQDVLFGLWQNRASLYDDGSSLQAYSKRSVAPRHWMRTMSPSWFPAWRNTTIRTAIR